MSINLLPAGHKIDMSHPKAFGAKVLVNGEPVQKCFEARAGRNGYAQVYIQPLKLDKRRKAARSKRIKGNVEVVL
ncbi:hypothetical protein N22_014 [Idiomarinaceae phage 1N2-2]|uniref:hypothetical protein n=1 Tax=Idiomarinaceae phage 1N2-2 TaxID=1536592 RepID=UPI0004F6C01C|nr:hypothetical protein N22_014 [Idiomarinaceae phage 1N2-2]AIM40716.1 hypothetical protein N22_014 [Idiomarinaceae phage 1N2-2]